MRQVALTVSDGEPGILDAKRILFRAGILALGNTDNGTAGYTLKGDEVVKLLNHALASGDRQKMLRLASYFDEANNSRLDDAAMPSAATG